MAKRVTRAYVKVWGIRKPELWLNVSHYEVRGEEFRYKLAAFGGWKTMPLHRVAILYTARA